MPRSRQQREDAEKRDDDILRLFIAGATYRQIARALDVGIGTVNRAVTKTLSAGAQRRELLSDEALAVHTERTERLFQAHWTKALNGDHRSAETCRKILAQQARLFGLGAEPAGLPAPTQALPGDDEGPQGRPEDELSKLRASRGAG